MQREWHETEIIKRLQTGLVNKKHILVFHKKLEVRIPWPTQTSNRLINDLVYILARKASHNTQY